MGASQTYHRASVRSGEAEPIRRYQSHQRSARIRRCVSLTCIRLVIARLDWLNADYSLLHLVSPSTNIISRSGS